MDETIPSLFARQAAALRQRPLFYVKRHGAYRPLTWQQVEDDVLALTNFLLHRQVTTGDRVVILSENRPEWGVADLGIQSVGAWSVPVYPSLTVQDLRAICRDCKPVAAVVSTAEQAAKLLAVSAAEPSLRSILVMEPPADLRHELLRSWSEALAEGRGLGPKLEQLLELRRKQIRPDDTATVIYTSGTTGEPKGVMLSHRNFLSNVEACLAVIPISGSDLHLSFLPLSHVFERMAGWYLPLSIGSMVAYAETMDTIPQNMLEVRPTVMLGVPRFFEKLHASIQDGLRRLPPMKRRLASWALAVGRVTAARRMARQPLPLALRAQRAVADWLVFRKLQAHLGSRLRFFISGSAPLSKDIGEFFFSVGVTILEGYGLTETSPVIAVNRLPTPRFGSVGQPIPDVEVWIADDGEILTRGPHVMQGYYQKPDATAAAIVDGWFYTGDIGSMDREGYLVITDRKKDLIKTAGGKFVAPQRIESLLVSDPYISQAFVYGDRRPYCVALVVPKAEPLRRYAQEQEIGAQSLTELVAHPKVVDFYWTRVQAKQQDLAGFEQIKKIALLDQEFSQASGELTPTLKAKRKLIAERYAAILQRLYEP